MTDVCSFDADADGFDSTRVKTAEVYCFGNQNPNNKRVEVAFFIDYIYIIYGLSEKVNPHFIVDFLT